MVWKVNSVVKPGLILLSEAERLCPFPVGEPVWNVAPEHGPETVTLGGRSAEEPLSPTLSDTPTLVSTKGSPPLGRVDDVIADIDECLQETSAGRVVRSLSDASAEEIDHMLDDADALVHETTPEEVEADLTNAMAQASVSSPG